MKTWQLAAIGVVAAAAAGLTLPDMLEQRKAKQAAAERDAAIAAIEAKLTRQEEEQKAAVAARKPGVSLASLRKSRSDVDGVDWYSPASMAKNDVFTAYLGDKGAAPWLRVYLSRCVRHTDPDTQRGHTGRGRNSRIRPRPGRDQRDGKRPDA